MRKTVIDIHNYELKFGQAEAQVRSSEISDRNKHVIFSYRDACLLQQVCKKVRLIRVFGVLVLFARHLGKDFDQASKEDIQAALGKLVVRQPPYSPETLGTYKAIIKRFMSYVVAPDNFPRGPTPPIVSWITGHVKRSEKKRLDRNDLLTPQDIENVLGVTRNPRDRALISMLWETGGRIAEIGNLQIKHISKVAHGYQLDVNGKTGRRSPLVVSSAPYLSQWLASHPFAGDMESPLWVHYQYHARAGHLHYDTIAHLLAHLFARAGVKKHIYPHLFRHSRARTFSPTA
jgi:integrase/recombinase XerD